MSGFAIVLAEQPHRLVFGEAVEVLAWGLRELGHEVRTSTALVPSWRNIVMAPHLLLASDESPRIEPGTIVYNGEPYNSPLFVRSLRLLSHPNAVPWDYSARTTDFLRALAVPARTVPFAWCPSLARRRSGASRSVDVLFTGSMSPRRRRVLEDLAALAPPGFVIKTLWQTYGAERDAWLLQSKVALNVHYWDEGGVEDLRVVFAAANNVAVVSEGIPDEPYKAPWARWVPYDELAAECVRLACSGEWAQQAALGCASVQTHDIVAILRDALAGKP